MTNKEIILNEIKNFKTELKHENIFFHDNGKLQVEKSISRQVKQFQNLEHNEGILLLFYYKKYEEGGIFKADKTNYHITSLMSDKIIAGSVEDKDGIFNDDTNTYFHEIFWNEIESVEKIPEDDKSWERFRFFLKNSNDIKDIPCYKFGYLSDDSSVSDIVSKLLNSIASKYIDTEQVLVDKISKNIENKNYEEALNLINKYDTEQGNDLSKKQFSTYIKSVCLSGQNLFEAALKEINKSVDIYKEISINELNSENDDIEYTEKDIDYNGMEHLFKQKGLINRNLDNSYEALKNLHFALKNTEENEEKQDIEDEINVTYQKLKGVFFDYPHNQRKILLIDNSFIDLSSEKFKVLLKKDLPEIKFPIGHPIEKELYIGHPYNPNIYIPLSEYEFSLFLDRINEFCYVLQCLGASEFSIESKKGKDTDILKNENLEVAANVGVSLYGASSERTKTENKHETSNIKQKISKKQTFSPTKKPYLPDNLVWYPHETAWQRLYEQRTNGSILTFEETISTQQNKLVSTNELMSINAEFKAYINVSVKAGIKVNRQIEKEFKEQETTAWNVKVEFVPIEQLTGNNKNQISESKLTNQIDFTDNEQKYLEEIKFMLEDDGIIDDDERKMLIRKRKKYEISEERAIEMENSLLQTSQFTKEEQEYIDEIKECAEDGEITDGDRRILKRLANKLNITEERAIELENSILKVETKQFTETELTYIEEIKYCLEDDGEISKSERRLLNKERDKLEIPPERAEEIEQEFIREIKK